jgi:ATP-dependent Clp protease adapter protein ClpS
VKEQHAWAVAVQNDSANTLADVAYVLHEVCSLPPERGFALATKVHKNGEAQLATYPTREEAEHLVVEIRAPDVRAGNQTKDAHAAPYTRRQRYRQI